MKSFDGKGRTALITGASAGIGAQFARVFAQHGFDVVLVARREERLTALAAEIERTHGVRVTALPFDLGLVDAPQLLFDDVKRRGIAIDALVNNAGYGMPGYFRRSPWSEHARFLQVMITSLTHLVHLFEPGMVERRWGRILNVASLAGLVPPGAGHTLYSAAKSFVLRFSESLALEHRNDGVHVTAVCPGFTYSEFHDVVGNRKAVSKLPRFMWMDAESVARQGYAAVMKGDVVYVNGPVNRGLAALARLVPERTLLAVMREGGKRLRV